MSRTKLNSIATALSADNASDAMGAFDKSYPKYETLSNYFEGLANAFQITNEIDVTDEQDAPAEIKLTVRWAMTLQDSQTNYTENRAADIDVRFIKHRSKWKSLTSARSICLIRNRIVFGNADQLDTARNSS